MKTTTILSLMISLNFCQLLQASPIHKMGGVSGGGGNTIVTEPVLNYQDPEHVEHIILQSKTMLYKYVQAKKYSYTMNEMNESQKKLYDRLFIINGDKKTKIENLVDTVSLNVKDDKPCFTLDKIEVDGSIYSDKPRSICISAKRISKKIQMMQLEDQAVALMMHEMSELAGANEDEAVMIQKNALIDLKNSR